MTSDNKILIKLTDWKLWIIIAFVPCIVSLGVSLHDVSIDANKAHSDWYNAWKGGIATVISICIIILIDSNIIFISRQKKD